MGNGRTIIGGIVIIVGIAALVAGIMYLTIPAHSLPSFFPGHVGNGKHTHRGYAGIGVGVVLLIVGIVVIASGRRRRYHY